MSELVQGEVAVTRNHARMGRGLVLPLIALKAVLFGAYLHFDAKLPEETPYSYSCDDLTPDVLNPPTDDTFGFAPGLQLDSRQITKAAMEPMIDHWGDQVTLEDGTAVGVKFLGRIANNGGELGGNFSELPDDYISSWRSALQIKEVRWLICQQDGGVTLKATDTSPLRNANYDHEKEGTEFTFAAGEQDDLFDEGRDLAYAQIHEGGHFLRDQIMTGTNEQDKKAVEHIDSLYEQHLSMALEEYRTVHGQQIIDDLNGIEAQFIALDTSIFDSKNKQSLQRAIAYCKDKLAQPGGLGELGIEVVTNSNDVSEVRLARLNNMIAKALKVTAKKETPRLYGLSEFFQKYSAQLDSKLLHRTYNEITQFLVPRFLTEEVLPGSKGSHSWQNSNELFTTSWVLTGLASPNRYEEILASIPEKYQQIALEQLKTAAELRRTIDPEQFQD